METTQQPSSTEIEHVEGMVVEPGAIAQIERANVDMQIETAHKYPLHSTPSQIANFRQKLIDMATADDETALSCIYNKPVGKDPDTGRQKYVTGPSIRLAEMGAVNYGNIRVSAQIIEMTPRYVKARGVAHDLETNVAVSVEVVEATVYNNGPRRGQPYSESQRITIAKATVAKARRDAFYMIIRPFIAAVIQRIKETISGKKAPLETRRAGVLDWLSKIKPFEPERVFHAFGKTTIDEMGHEDLDELKITLSSIQQGETNLDEAFPPVPVKEDAKATDKATLEGRLGAKKGKASKDTPPPAKVDPGAVQTPPDAK